MYGTGLASQSAKSQELLSWRPWGCFILPLWRNKTQGHAAAEWLVSEGGPEPAHCDPTLEMLLLCPASAAEALLLLHSAQRSPVRSRPVQSGPVQLPSGLKLNLKNLKN